MDDYNLYRVAGGPVKEAIEQWRAERDAAEERLDAFIRRVGATPDHYYGNERGISALLFDAPPDGWRVESGNYYCPSGKTKAGKALRAEMGKLGLPGAESFSNKIGLGLIIQGTRIKRAGFEQYGDALVLLIPKASTHWTAPEGCEPMKMSEYWALREQYKDVEEVV